MDRMHEIMDFFHHDEEHPKKDPLNTPVASLLFENNPGKARGPNIAVYAVDAPGQQFRLRLQRYNRKSNLVKSGLLLADMVEKAKEIDVRARNQKLQAEKEGQEVLLVTKHAVVSGAQEASRGVFTGLVEGKIEVVVDPRNHIVVPFELRLSGSARGSSNLTASKAAMLSTFAADLSNPEAAYLASLLGAPSSGYASSASTRRPPKAPKAPRSSRKAKKLQQKDMNMMEFSNPISPDSEGVRTPSTVDGADNPLFDDVDRSV
jgi:hypothetical protein